MSHPKYAFQNGKVVPWEDATVHVFSPAAKYGAGVFEGIRGYWNPDKEDMYLFKMEPHLERLMFSQKVMDFETVYDPEYFTKGTLELIRANDIRETVHIRTIVHIEGPGESSARGPVGTAITVVPRPLPKRVTTGCTAQVSSWMRSPDTSTPMRVKCNANYNNGRLAALQATRDGYDTAILLNQKGQVSEGPGMCFFMVRDGVPVTPSVTNDILESVTRKTVLEICEEYFGVKPVERDIDRSELYAAEEAFFCGTGWEICPINSIDKLPVGTGKPGEFTCKLRDTYFRIVKGEVNDHADWRMPVYGGNKAKAAAE
ncbi:MAG: branched-chain amino acid transaminase [Acetobacterales bacterium]